MLEKNLEMIGLSPSEVKVYLCLLRSGCSYPNEISSRTGINRTNVYEALDRLCSKGFISFVEKNKVKWFEAGKNDKAISFINDKMESLANIKDELSSEIKELGQSSINNKKLEASIFVGKKGLKMLFEEILSAKRPISLIGSELQFTTFFGAYFRLWHKRRIKSRIPQRSIIPMRFQAKVRQMKFISYRFVDDRFTNPSTTIIYGDVTLLIQWSEDAVAVRIDNAKIAKSHRNYFDQLWDSISV